MLDFIDRIIDSITMYKLLLYYLIAIVLAAIGLSWLKVLNFNPVNIAVSTLVLVGACYVINKIIGWFLYAPVNSESSLITGLILALIIAPMAQVTPQSIILLLAASGLAMASKYVLAISDKHIFNPAAIAMVLMAYGPKQDADWWVGTTALIPIVVIGGFLIVRKIRHWPMVLTFIGTALLATIIYSAMSKGVVLTSLKQEVSSSALFFLAFVMLTEPLTSPPTATGQISYAVLVGLLFPPQFHIFSTYSTPEIALVVGNIYSYIISPKTRLFPILKQKIKLTPDTVDFVFQPDKKIKYKPGQYIEWTLPHSRPDLRGNRRIFTLSSSPTEPDLRIGVKFYNRSSTFKEAMLKMDRDSLIAASQIAGDFTLPKNQSKKLAFIAGGIGVTPYRSMVKYLMDTRQHRDISMIYSARKPVDFAYKDVFDQARSEIGLKVFYTITDDNANPTELSMLKDFINPDMIKQTIPDYRERTFYISGTHAMVEAVGNMLKELGVHRTHIKTDFFPGYA